MEHISRQLLLATGVQVNGGYRAIAGRGASRPRWVVAEVEPQDGPPVPCDEASVATQWSPRGALEVLDRGSYDGPLGPLGEIDMGRVRLAVIGACVALLSGTATQANYFLTGNELYRKMPRRRGCRGRGGVYRICHGSD
jgi:hypothetical protein